jgi:hypothetical protein
MAASGAGVIRGASDVRGCVRVVDPLASAPPGEAPGRIVSADLRHKQRIARRPHVVAHRFVKWSQRQHALNAVLWSVRQAYVKPDRTVIHHCQRAIHPVAKHGVTRAA